MPLSVRHSHSPFLAALSYIRLQAVGHAYGTGARKLAPSPSAPPSACWGRCPKPPSSSCTVPSKSFYLQYCFSKSLHVLLYTSMISTIVTYLLWYPFYDIYKTKVYNIYSISASLYTTFCVFASLSFSFQIALMFNTEVTLDTAT